MICKLCSEPIDNSVFVWRSINHGVANDGSQIGVEWVEVHQGECQREWDEINDWVDNEGTNDENEKIDVGKYIRQVKTIVDQDAESRKSIESERRKAYSDADLKASESLKLLQPQKLMDLTSQVVRIMEELSRGLVVAFQPNSKLLSIFRKDKKIISQETLVDSDTFINCLNTCQCTHVPVTLSRDAMVNYGGKHFREETSREFTDLLPDVKCSHTHPNGQCVRRFMNNKTFSALDLDLYWGMGLYDSVFEAQEEWYGTATVEITIDCFYFGDRVLCDRW